VYDNFLFLDRGNMMQASEAFVQQAFGKSGVSMVTSTIVLRHKFLLGWQSSTSKCLPAFRFSSYLPFENEMFFHHIIFVASDNIIL